MFKLAWEEEHSFRQNWLSAQLLPNDSTLSFPVSSLDSMIKVIGGFAVPQSLLKSPKPKVKSNWMGLSNVCHFRFVTSKPKSLIKTELDFLSIVAIQFLASYESTNCGSWSASFLSPHLLWVRFQLLFGSIFLLKSSWQGLKSKIFRIDLKSSQNIT